MKRIRRDEWGTMILPLLKESLPWLHDSVIKGNEFFSDNKYLRVYMNASDVIQPKLIDDKCKTDNHEVYINVCKKNEKDIAFSFVCKNCKKRKHASKEDEDISLTDFELAKMLSDIIRGRAVFVPNLSVWYYFDGKRWITDRDGSEIRLEINKSLLPCFQDKPKVKKSLQVTHRRDSIVKECRSLLKDNDFVSKLDSNPLLVGFENGVYDFGTRKFRDAVASDYVSFTTRCNFVTEYTAECASIMKEVMYFFGDIFLGKKADCNMLMNIFASAFNGTKRKQLFFVFAGGKSLIQLVN